MYETIEHWKQYKQEKALQEKLAQQFELFNECGFQYKDYDMSDYYKSKIQELKLKISKLI